MNDNMIQVGVCAIRAPDGRVIKDAPLFVPVTPAIQNATEFTYQDFALVAVRKIHDAKLREARERRKALCKTTT